MELFGIPVHRYSLSIDNTSLINYSYKLRQQQKSRQLSNNGGWQSEDLSVDTKEIVPLIEAIKHNILLSNAQPISRLQHMLSRGQKFPLEAAAQGLTHMWNVLVPAPANIK
jgi:hypothetical protein